MGFVNFLFFGSYTSIFRAVQSPTLHSVFQTEFSVGVLRTDRIVVQKVIQLGTSRASY